MTHDEERLERYLEWRRADSRERAARRRRAIGYVGAPALCLLAIGGGAWLAHNSSRADPMMTTSAPAPLPDRPAPTSDTAPVAPTAPPSSVELPDQPTPARQVITPRRRARASRPATPRPPSPAAPPQDLSASIAPPPTAPPEAAPDLAREMPTEAPVRIEAAPAPTVPAPSDVVAPLATAREDTVREAPVTPPQASTPAPAGGAVAVSPPTVRERVSRWAKGEVQEFRDGVKREADNFRSGYEKVRNLFRR